jgi:hypothetical protein
MHEAYKNENNKSSKTVEDSNDCHETEDEQEDYQNDIKSNSNNDIRICKRMDKAKESSKLDNQENIKSTTNNKTNDIIIEEDHRCNINQPHENVIPDGWYKQS